MRTFIFSLIIVLTFVSCSDDNSHEGDNCTISEFIIENYRDDAVQLYLHEIHNNPNHPNYNIVDIDESEVNQILSIIQSVYNLNIPERDTVFEVYDIPARLCYATSYLQLKVDPQNSAIQNLAANQIPTGNQALDSFLNTYGFDSVDLSYDYPQFPWLSIISTQELNLLPLEDEVTNLEGILMAEMNAGCVGDGNTIQIDREQSPTKITFSIGEGDCPAGCIYKKFWEFSVDNDCKASFVRMYEN